MAPINNRIACVPNMLWHLSCQEAHAFIRPLCRTKGDYVLLWYEESRRSSSSASPRTAWCSTPYSTTTWCSLSCSSCWRCEAPRGAASPLVETLTSISYLRRKSHKVKGLTLRLCAGLGGCTARVFGACAACDGRRAWRSAALWRWHETAHRAPAPSTRLTQVRRRLAQKKILPFICLLLLLPNFTNLFSFSRV